LLLRSAEIKLQLSDLSKVLTAGAVDVLEKEFNVRVI